MKDELDFVTRRRTKVFRTDYNMKWKQKLNEAVFACIFSFSIFFSDQATVDLLPPVFFESSVVIRLFHRCFLTESNTA